MSKLILVKPLIPLGNWSLTVTKNSIRKLVTHSYQGILVTHSYQGMAVETHVEMIIRVRAFRVPEQEDCQRNTALVT